MRRLVIFLTVALAVVWAIPALAGNLDDGTLSGQHYNLNIIGVDNPKDAKLINSNRHTIFVALNSSPGAPIDGSPKLGSTIWLTRGEFQVCDGNAWDTAYGCNGLPLGDKTTGGAKMGAVFQLPCNTYIVAQSGETLVDCAASEDPNATARYQVFVRALGSPKNTPTADWRTCAYDTGGAEWVCNTHNNLLIRSNEDPAKFQDVTYELTSLVDNDSGVLKRVRLFAADYQDWYWEYINSGVKLAQFRFYIVP